MMVSMALTSWLKIENHLELPDWYDRGQDVPVDELDELSANARWYLVMAIVHGDNAIEDPRPLEQARWQWRWRLCEVPLTAIFPERFSYQDPARLNSLRLGDSACVPPI